MTLTLMHEKAFSGTLRAQSLMASSSTAPLLRALLHTLIQIGQDVLRLDEYTISRSIAEAEYRGVANTVAKLTWLRNLLVELGLPLPRASVVLCDNVSVVYLSSNRVQVKVINVLSALQYAYIFTKGLSVSLFEDVCSSLSIWKPPASTTGGC